MRGTGTDSACAAAAAPSALITLKSPMSGSRTGARSSPTTSVQSLPLPEKRTSAA